MVEVTLSIYTLRKAKTISFQFVLHFPYFKKEKILSQTLNMGVKKKSTFLSCSFFLCTSARILKK